MFGLFGEKHPRVSFTAGSQRFDSRFAKPLARWKSFGATLWLCRSLSGNFWILRGKPHVSAEAVSEFLAQRYFISPRVTRLVSWEDAFPIDDDTGDVQYENHA